MAVSYKGLTIKFGGDTTGLQSALKSVQSESRKTNQDLKEIDKSLKFNPGNTELLAQKVRTLNKAYEETKTRLDAYKQALQQLEEKKARGEQLTDQEQRQYDSLQRSILQCENQLESYKGKIKDASTEMEASKTKLYQLGQTLEDNSEKLKKHGEHMETAGKAMMATSAAITGASLAAFNEIDSGMDAVVKATGATGEAAEALGESVKNVATTVAGSSNDWEAIGNTVGEVNTRFGATGEELEELSELFFKFSEITGVDSVQAVQNAAKAMEAFGVDSSHTNEVLGVFAKVAQDSGMSADALMQAVVTNGATFREMGLDIDDAAVMLGKFEQAGVPADQMLAGLKKAAASCAKSGDDLGTSLEDLTKRLQDPKTEAEATKDAIELFGSKAAVAFVDAAKSGRVNFSDLKQTLSDYGSTVGDTFDETVDGVDQLNVAEKELQAAGAELGSAFSDTLGPIVHEFAQVVHQVAEAFKSLSPEQKEFIAKAVLITGAVGGVTLGFGKLFEAAGNIGAGLKNISSLWSTVSGALSNVGGISGAFGTLTSTVGSLASTIGGTLSGAWTAFTGLIAANPIGLGIAAVAAAIAGLTWFFTQTELGRELWGKFTKFISDAWNGVCEFFKGVPEFWKGIWDSVTGKIKEVKEALGNAWDNIKKGAAEKWEGIKSTIGGAWDTIKNTVSERVNNLKTNISNAWTAIKTGTATAFNAVKDTVTKDMKAAQDAGKHASGALQAALSGDWKKAKEEAASAFESIRSRIAEKIKSARDTVKDVGNKIGEILGFPNLGDKVAGVFDRVRDSIKEKIEFAKKFVGDAIEKIKGFFNFEFKWPHIPLPHINWHWEDLGGILSLPVFDGIEWYAKGGAIAPNDPHLIGVGDSGEREWIEPESKLLGLIEQAVAHAGGAAPVNVEVNVNATITGRQSSYEVGQQIGRGISSVMKQRGHSYA